MDSLRVSTVNAAAWAVARSREATRPLDEQTAERASSNKLDPQVSTPRAAPRTTASPSPSLDECLHCRELSANEKRAVEGLERTDRAVRAHESAHVAAGGALTGTPHYQYEVGPDGKRYAVGGEVPIDTTPVANDPAATIRKAEQIQRAALAPVDPSAADRAVAAKAARMEAEARNDAFTERIQEARDDRAQDQRVQEKKAADTTSRPSDALRRYRQVAAGTENE